MTIRGRVEQLEKRATPKDPQLIALALGGFVEVEGQRMTVEEAERRYGPRLLIIRFTPRGRNSKPAERVVR